MGGWGGGAAATLESTIGPRDILSSCRTAEASRKKKENRRKWKRCLLIGLATVGGGAVIGKMGWWPCPGRARVGTGSRAHSHDGLLAHFRVKSPLFSPTCSGEKFRLLAPAHMLLCGLGPPHTAASQPPARATLYFGGTARPSPAALRLLSAAGGSAGRAASLPRAEAVCSRVCREAMRSHPHVPHTGGCPCRRHWGPGRSSRRSRGRHRHRQCRGRGSGLSSRHRHHDLTVRRSWSWPDR